MDAHTGPSGAKQVLVLVVQFEKQSAWVSISARVGEGFTFDLMLSIQGAIPEDASLYLAVGFDNVLHFLPNLGTESEPFRSLPKETYSEKVLSVPISSIPYKEYTFYAALLNSSMEFVSNLDKAFASADFK